MREIKELLEIILICVESSSLTHGLCKVINACYNEDHITLEEVKHINYYMFNNQPVTVFYDWKNNQVFDKGQFWYKLGEKEPRIEWLKKHIELNTKTKEK